MFKSTGCSLCPKFVTDSYIEELCLEHDKAYQSNTGTWWDKTKADLKLARKVSFYGLRKIGFGFWIYFVLGFLFTICPLIGGWVAWYYYRGNRLLGWFITLLLISITVLGLLFYFGVI